jgi:condensin-2 complex subunit G2
LGAVFPLADGVNVDKAIQKAILALKHLLQDTDPRVRVAGSEATAAVLVTLWDALPPTDIRALLNHVIAEHASDVSSSAVRVGAVHAVSTILDAEQSHAVLRALLPSLGNLIHDKVERVRLATVRLLAKIKGIPGIKYYHVVPVHHLLARLVKEGRPAENVCNPVASALNKSHDEFLFPTKCAYRRSSQ